MSELVDGDLTEALESEGRLRLSEEGVSYRLVRLVERATLGRGWRIRVREFARSAESKNGADLELWFKQNAQWLGWRIQAKRTTLSGRNYPYFASLDKETGGTPQYESLIRGTESVNGLAPIYWMYSGRHSDGPTSTADCIYVLPAESVRSITGKRTRGNRANRWSSWLNTTKR